MRYALTYDCNLFDVNGICVGIAGSYANYQDGYGSASNTAEFSGVLTGALRIGTSVRVGGFLDFRGDTGKVDGIEVTGHAPMFGGFIGYSQEADGLGLQARGSIAYEQNGAEFTRANLIGRAAKVTGDADFATLGAAGILGWGFGVGEKATLTPFLGLTATKSERQSYSENGKPGAVGDPLRYGDYAATQVTGLIGARLEGMFTDQLGYRLGAAVEHDFSYDLDAFKVSGNFGSDSYKSSEAPADWRVGGTAGVSYFFTPTRELTLDGYANSFREDAMDYAVMVGFKFGL